MARRSAGAGVPRSERRSFMNPFPHQLLAVREAQASIAAGVRRTCVTSPTGGGKSFIAAMLIEEWLAAGEKVILYTNRRMLVDQLHRTLAAHGLEPAMRAAGHEENHDAPLQVASIQTENSRVRKRKTRELFPATRVLIDEAHLQCGDMASDIVTGHIGAGAFIVGLTATPLDIGPMYDKLIVAGTNSELRGCGLLVPAQHFGPDEPDMKGIKREADCDELTEKEVKTLMGAVVNGRATKQLEALHGRVWHHFERLNPDRRPTILFAPGVAESLWFAEQFTKMGVNAAHIDGQDVWVEGEFHKTSTDVRRQVMEASKDGRLKVICNRFVLREGIDCPWLAHGIFATVFGSLQSYLQSGGRLLRASPGLEFVTVQDHGGNWWRWGSLNEDREWRLDGTARMLSGMRADRMRRKACPQCERFGPTRDCSVCQKYREPGRCPVCAKIVGVVIPGKKCPWCDAVFLHGGKKSRPVVTSDGELKEMTGDIFRPRRVCDRNDAQHIWERIYFGSFPPKNPEKLKRWKPRTFKQAEAVFAYKNNWTWPSHDLPFMPIDPADWYRHVHEVPRSRLK